MENKILNIPSMSMFNDNWDLLLKFMDNEGNPPFHIEGDLDFGIHEKMDLGNLVSVGGNLDLSNVEIHSLGNLKSVGGNLRIPYGLDNLGVLEYVGGEFVATDENHYSAYYEDSAFYLTSLGKLKRVNNNLILGNCTNLESLGELEYVAGYLDIANCFRLDDLGKVKYIGGDLYIYNTELMKFSNEELRKKCRIGGDIVRENEDDGYIP